MISIKEIVSNSKGGHNFFIPSTDDHFLFAKYINALINSELGGIIYIGINQKNKIYGVFPTYEFETIQSINKHYFLKDVHFLSEVIELNKKLIIKLSIDPSIVKPQFVINNGKKEVYLIHEGELIKANYILEKALKYKEINGIPPADLSNDEVEIKKKIELNANISLNNLYKVTSLPKKTIDFVLVRLLNWNQINFKIFEGSCSFTLN